MVKKEISQEEIIERAKTPTFIKFGVWYPIVAILVSVIALVALLIPAILLGLNPDSLKTDITTILIVNDVLFLVLSLLILLGVKLSKRKIKDLFSIKGIKPKTFVLVGISYALLQPIFAIVAYIIGLFSHTEVAGNSSSILQNQITPVNLVAVALLAPLFEELFFRGALFDGFLNSFRKFIPVKDSIRVASTIAFTAVFFGLMHLDSSKPLGLSAVVTVLTITLLGGSLAVLRVRTGSLALGMFAHLMFNSMGLALVGISLLIGK
jgi:membrane protease YdiL (CAAX protease family)